MSVMVAACVSIALALLTLGRVRRLSMASRQTAGRGPLDVSVVIPARNEALSLPTLLQSLHLASPQACEVIVVDDDSTDDTAAIALGAGVTLVKPGALRTGWAGKPSACATGAAQARSDVLIFLDADTALHPSAVGALTELARRHGGLCSVQPCHRTEAAYEQLSLMFNIVALMGSGQFGVVRPQRSVRSATAFGPCLATMRSSYESVGGHSAAPTSVVDDIALAKVYAQHDMPTDGWLGSNVVSYRMYPGGVRSLIEGWTKNIALGATSASLVSVGFAVAWVTAMLWGSFDFVIAVAHWPTGGTVPWLSLAGFALTAVQVTVLARLVGRFRWWVGLAAPLLLLFFLVIFLRSGVLVMLGRPVRWRGRTVATRQVSRRNRH